MSEKTVHLVFQVLNFLHSYDSTPFQLLDSEKLLLITLASHKGAKGIFPSVRTLARELKKGESSVRRIIAGLRNKGVILVDHVSGKSNYYSILNLSTTPLTGERGIATDPSHAREGSPLTHERGTPLTHEQIRTKGNNKGIKERGRTKRAVPLSDDFEPSRKSVEVAKESGLTEQEANIEFDKFINYYLERGDEKTDWNLVLQNWMIRAGEWKGKKLAKQPAAEEVRSTVPWFNATDRGSNTPLAHERGQNTPSSYERGALPVARLLNGLAEKANEKMNGGKPNGLGSKGQGKES